MKRVLTQGQMLSRFRDHARAKHRDGEEWCHGCFMRWGAAFPGAYYNDDGRKPRKARRSK